jgi:hypothetical protein
MASGQQFDAPSTRQKKNCAKPNKNITRNKRVSGRRPPSSIGKNSVLFPSSGGKVEITVRWSYGPLIQRLLPPSRLGTDTDPISETSCPFGIQDDGRRPRTSVTRVQYITAGRFSIQKKRQRSVKSVVAKQKFYWYLMTTYQMMWWVILCARSHTCATFIPANCSTESTTHNSLSLHVLLETSSSRILQLN